VDAARIQLANAMLSAANEGSRDAKFLKHAALLVMKGDYITGTRNG
jgi:hypothetical protein